MATIRCIVLRSLGDDKVQMALQRVRALDIKTPNGVKDIFREVTGAPSLVEITGLDLSKLSEEQRRNYLHDGIAYGIKPDGTIDFNEVYHP